MLLFMNTTFPSSHTHYYIHITTHITTYTLLLPVALQPYLLQARVTYIHITTHTLLLTHTYIHITTYYVHIPTYTLLHTHYYIHITTYYVVVYINYVSLQPYLLQARVVHEPLRDTHMCM